MAKTYSIKALVEILDRTSRPLESIGRGFDEVSKRIAKTGAQLNKIGKGMSTFGTSLSTKLTLPLVAMGGLALKSSFDFNEAMANIATLIPGNIKRIEELKLGVQDMAVSVGKSTSDLSGGLYQVISAFGDSSESLAILNTNARAATAGLSTTMDAINLTSAVTKAYGDTSAKAVEKAADLGLLAVRLGQTTFPELASSIGRVTSLAAQLNVKQEELFAGFASLTGVTGSAAEVSTQMAAILRAMLKPTTDMQKASKKLGFASTAQMIKSKGLVESLKLLMKYTKGDEQATAKLFGRAEALTAVFSLSGPLADKYTDSLNAMKESAGALNDAFKEVTDGINRNGFTWKQFLSLLQVIGQEIGDTLGPAFIKILKVLREWLIKFRALSPQTKKFILIIAGLAAALGPALIIVGKFIAAISVLMKLYKLFTVAQWLLNAAMAANPIGLIIIAIIALTGYIAYAIKHWNEFGAAMMLMLGPIGLIVSLFKTLYDRWDSIKQAFKTGGILGVLKEIGRAILDSVLMPMQQLLEIISKIPGIGKFAKIGAEKLGTFRQSFLSAMPAEKTKVNISDIDQGAADKIGKADISKLIKDQDYSKVFNSVRSSAESKTQVEVKVSADNGSTATINKVKTSGKPKIRIQNATDLGIVHALGATG